MRRPGRVHGDAGVPRTPRTGEEIVAALRTSCGMDTALPAIVKGGRPDVREHVWNWSVIMVVVVCLSFWSAVIAAIAYAV
jgi:hypothetical protein